MIFNPSLWEVIIGETVSDQEKDVSVAFGGTLSVIGAYYSWMGAGSFACRQIEAIFGVNTSNKSKKSKENVDVLKTGDISFAMGTGLFRITLLPVTLLGLLFIPGIVHTSVLRAIFWIIMVLDFIAGAACVIVAKKDYQMIGKPKE